jgi:hypothetical protein
MGNDLHIGRENDNTDENCVNFWVIVNREQTMLLENIISIHTASCEVVAADFKTMFSALNSSIQHSVWFLHLGFTSFKLHRARKNRRKVPSTQKVYNTCTTQSINTLNMLYKTETNYSIWGLKTWIVGPLWIWNLWAVMKATSSRNSLRVRRSPVRKVEGSDSYHKRAAIIVSAMELTRNYVKVLEFTACFDIRISWQLESELGFCICGKSFVTGLG